LIYFTDVFGGSSFVIVGGIISTKERKKLECFSPKRFSSFSHNGLLQFRLLKTLEMKHQNLGIK
jgi:hypothetical protein